MKHFEIDLYVGSAVFTYKCSTAFEALEALADIRAAKLPKMDMDIIMGMLVRCKHGELYSHKTNVFAIRYVDGEI